MKTEQEKLVLSNYEWALLIKQISSIVNKADKLKEGSMWTPSRTKKKAERIKEMGLECLEIIKYKNIKDG